MDNRRWTREECPYPIIPGKRRAFVKLHDEIIKWDDFAEEDKKMLLEVKKTITLITGKENIIIKVFGSRIKGNWTKSSDWDIAIIGESFNFEMQNKIRSYNYGNPIDIQFYPKKAEINDILIP